MKFSIAIFLASTASSTFANAFTPTSHAVGRTTGTSSALNGGMSNDVGIPCTEECALESFPNLPDSIHPGVLSGQAMMDLLQHAKDNGYAIPAVNCISSSGINACLEAAKANDAPIIIQFSSGGSQFYGGKGLDNTDYRAAIAGAVSGAFHTRTMAEQYGVPVILHTDHCSKELLPWVDGLVSASERYYKTHGEPLFSSHMIDLSEEPLEENLSICKDYLTRMEKVGLLLEMELGITGGEEDGVDNSDRPVEDLYSKPEEIYETYRELNKVSDKFTVAAAFGNVHGVYSPGNVKLDPEILNNAQKFISDKLGDKAPENKLPVSFVFHGGSGSDVADIQRSLTYGVIKMNIDTDTQWSYWEGIKNFEEKYHDYLQGQIGNPDGDDKPNKKYYDPRECMRAGEVNTVKRLEQAFSDLKCQNILGLKSAAGAKNVLGPRRGGLPV
ncbi:fructose-1,6-biphosphate aldolase precursor [Fragilariopsis cylindrus CCMP1102]|uniref:fructose-bisphosphate aldolase n=1 Tax=Fragilariopsis cylindrus CCMP1102 TaxID=635003 RepID=A0A1E7FAR3_9STRA|nr:fructose-1,6-biphosphate aldolase precursor [Fragilariopsis cylindrus CCMP1102]|eukprot:OEU15248.1 fructose-1,6-biphosphate aldolase precursor [Fragilariopsis cylindrus CCMP1102]